VTWSGSPTRDLDYVAPSTWASWYPDGASDIPTIFTIEGSSLRVKPLDDTALTVTYNQRTTALESALNWLYSNHFDAYLFGSLTEANAFNKDVDPAGLWKARRDEVFDEISKLDFNERQGMAIRVTGITP
jgi:hypothetical protein